MPRKLQFSTFESEVATEDELLVFANKVRAAGGADPISALLPSMRMESRECLIARALNFECGVTPHYSNEKGLIFKDGTQLWVMIIHDRPKAFTQELAKKLNMSTIYTIVGGEPRLALRLPKHIGNAAEAFDAGDAFTEYDRNA